MNMLRLAIRQHIAERLKGLFLPALIVLIWLISSGVLGFARSFGIPHLFWHYEPFYFIASCISLGAFGAVWCFVSMLLDTNKQWFLSAAQRQQTISLKWLGGYLFVSSTLVMTLLMSAHQVYVTVHWLPTSLGGISSVVAWLLGMLGLTVVISLLGVSYWVSGGSQEPQPGLETLVKNASFSRQNRAPWWIHRTAFVFTILFVVMPLAIVMAFGLLGRDIVHPTRGVLAPAAVLLLFLSLVTLVYGPLRFYRHQGWIWSLVVLLCSSAIGYALWIGLTAPTIRAAPTVTPSVPYQQALADSIGQTLPNAGIPGPRNRVSSSSQLIAQHKGDYLIVVAVSGGGIRAQVWTNSVLGIIEKNIRNFKDRTRMVTGTSGGMVGATYFVSTWAHDRKAGTHFDGTRTLSPEQMVYISSRDALTPVLKGLLLHDAFRGVLPSYFRDELDEQGAILEDTWAYWASDPRNRSQTDWNSEEHDSVFNRKLSDLLPYEEDGRVPSLVFAPTIAEDGRRLVATNFPMDELVVTESNAGELVSVSGLQLSRAFPSFAKNIQLKTLARLNANFPFIVASPKLPTNPALHVMDAGYYDNYGGEIAGKWLYENRQQLKKMLDSGKLKGVALVQISASNLNRAATDSTAEPSSIPELGGFASASFQKAIYMSDHYQAELRDFLDSPASQDGQAKRQKRFRTFNFEFSGDVSLSWYLTPAETYALIYPFLPDASGSKVKGDLVEYDPEQLSSPEFAQEGTVFTSEFGDGKAMFERRSKSGRFSREVAVLQQTKERCRRVLSELAEWMQ